MREASDTCTTCGAILSAGVTCATCGETTPHDPYIGRRLGERYQIRELIGVGGMGRVYRAVHIGLDRMVAVKLIHPKHLVNHAAAARFIVEARAASRLNHPNVVAIHDFGGGSASDGPELYLVMELLAGPSLGEVLSEGPMPLPRITDILCQILGALDEAHRNGVTHRDIKPENIILEPVRAGSDYVKVIDFGVAKLHEGASVTRFGEIVGTPRYMAPEQARGEPAGPAADLYAVGVLMFQMLTGRRPFEGGMAYEVIAKILTAERPDPRAFAPDREISAVLAAVCTRAMEIEPESRHPSAEAFARALLDAAGRTWSPKHSLMFARRPQPTTRPPPPITPRSARITPGRGGGHTPGQDAASSRPPGMPRLRLPAFTPTPAPTPTPRPVTMGETPKPPARPAASTRVNEHERPTLRIQRVAKGGPAPGPPRAAHDPPARPLPRDAEVRAAPTPTGPRDDTIRTLAEAYQAARREVLSGELDATTAWAPMGRKLAAALLDAGRMDEAYGVLSELLEHTNPRTIEQALIAEQLSQVAQQRGRTDEAYDLLHKALEIAEALGDGAVSARIYRVAATSGSGVRPSTRNLKPPSSRGKAGAGRGG